MSNFKLEFTLKQHTPIIHFQAEQKGATLRATELKPKLDRFLIDKLKMLEEDGKPKEEYRSWFIGGGKLHLALEYKVKIYEYGDPSPFIEPSKFIGNMEDDKNISEKFHKGITLISLTSFNEALLNQLKENMSNFLLQTNFGARTSKGYGSFYLFNEKNNKYEDPDFSFVSTKVYQFRTTKYNCIDDIALLNSFFRSGINYPCAVYSKKDAEKNSMHIKGNIKNGCPKIINDTKGTRVYVKSALFSYLNDETDISWDKKQIKHIFKPMEKNIEADVNATLARDLFGLSKRQDWQTQTPNKKMTIKKEHATISRFKSPIIYKPLIATDVETKGNSEIIVTFWANDSYKKILDEEFTIKGTDRSETLSLKTPIYFSFADFFKYIAESYTVTIDNVFSKEPEVQSIKRMLKDIKEFAHA